MTTAMAVSAIPEEPSRLAAYRDDGPLARMLGRQLGAHVPVPAPALTLLSTLPLIVVLTLGGGDLPKAALGGAVLWTVLTGGLASGRPDGGRAAWTVPPLMRLVEYVTLLAFAAIAGPSSVPFCFALVGTLAFHHYDIVYRQRHLGVTPPEWLALAGGGWEVRLVLGYVLLLIGAVSTGFLIAATVLAVLYVGESVGSWLRSSRPRPTTLSDNEDDEDE